MSSLSPEQTDGRSTQSPPDAGPSGDKPRSGSLNLNVFKTLTERRGMRDGSQPKKRGPKPDSKPALTRRQEMNRQAQRTHRERKEQYVKSLEEEVLRLKDIYSTVSQDKSQLADENRQLRELLFQHGIALPPNVRPDGGSGGQPPGDSPFGNSPGGGSSNIFSPGGASHSTGPTTSSATPPSNHFGGGGQQLQNMTQQASIAKGVDYNQAGIDFVLTWKSEAVHPDLERPCMSHIPFLVDRADKPEGEPCGHALMASCPPQPVDKLAQGAPFGAACQVRDDTGQQTWNISKADLATLMDLSGHIDLDGEITPVAAWCLILSHPRFMELDASDLEAIAGELARKVRCYGFGAVTEEFEVRDAIEGVLSAQPPMIMQY